MLPHLSAQFTEKCLMPQHSSLPLLLVQVTAFSSWMMVLTHMSIEVGVCCASASMNPPCAGDSLQSLGEGAAQAGGGLALQGHPHP